MPKQNSSACLHQPPFFSSPPSLISCTKKTKIQETQLCNQAQPLHKNLTLHSYIFPKPIDIQTLSSAADYTCNQTMENSVKQSRYCIHKNTKFLLPMKKKRSQRSFFIFIFSNFWPSLNKIAPDVKKQLSYQGKVFLFRRGKPRR